MEDREVKFLAELSLEKLNKTIEELNVKTQNQDNFLLNITHDLRGHLNVIISAVQYMQYNNKDEKELRYLNMIKRNSYKMLKLINNLIDTTKLENNFYKLDKKNIEIVPMIEGTVSCIEKYASEKNISLIFDTNIEECLISVDPEAIDRIIMNLISNAIKFSPNESNIYVFVDIDENEVKISVKDEGVGISKEDQERIFDRFYQCNNRSNKDVIGSGIGLDLSNYLAKLHGGKIILESQIGVGSEFLVIIPRIVDANNEEKEQEYSSKIQMLEMEFSDIYLS